MVRRIVKRQLHPKVLGVLAYQPPEHWLIQISPTAKAEDREQLAMALLAQLDEVLATGPHLDADRERSALLDAVFAADL